MPVNHVGAGQKSTRKTLAAKKTVGVCPLRGLVCYGSRTAAKKAAKDILSQGKGNTREAENPGRGLHEFQCQTCGHWHLGH